MSTTRQTALDAQTVGRPSPLSLFWSVALLGGSLVLTMVTATAQSNSVSLAGRDGALYGCLAAVGFLGLTSRVTIVDGGRNLLLVNFLRSVEVAVTSIKAVRSDDGFVVEVIGGGQLKSFAMSASIVGTFTGYRGASKACDRLRQWLPHDRPRDSHAKVAVRTRSALRLAILWPLGFSLLATLLASTR